MALLLKLLAESPACSTQGISAIPPGNFPLKEIISVMKEKKNRRCFHLAEEENDINRVRQNGLRHANL